MASMKTSMPRQVLARARPSARVVRVVAATPSNWREALSKDSGSSSSSSSSYKPAAPASRPSSASAPSSSARPSSRTPKVNVPRTSPEALAQFRREMGGLSAGAPPSTPSRPASSSSAPSRPASSSNWRESLSDSKPASRPASSASSAPARPSSRTPKVNVPRTSPEALAAFRREMGGLSAGAPSAPSTPSRPASSSSSAPSRPASSSNWRESLSDSKPAAPAEARPSSRTPKPHPSTFKKTTPEQLAAFRREMSGR